MMENERAERFLFPQTLSQQGGILPLPNDEAAVLISPMLWGCKLLFNVLKHKDLFLFVSTN
ncbi:hypothetical protein HMPREF1565_0997 [Providencia alcalifaciens RIMD 1656011]|uniref:hypothetical protein n=1 Tax=Providencia alcalifaciens TaxID=126385 RepID=UPI00044E2D94|nr:hypothetical protein [Providencia alcalifaciens]EUD04571.1 hypothetical protein HMPREF1565_0997 [Providencia alcalifaciens RIMD 1656011]